MAGKARGVFGNQAMGSFTGGIFSGPTALGIPNSGPAPSSTPAAPLKLPTWGSGGPLKTGPFNIWSTGGPAQVPGLTINKNYPTPPILPDLLPPPHHFPLQGVWSTGGPAYVPGLKINPQFPTPHIPAWAKLHRPPYGMQGFGDLDPNDPTVLANSNACNGAGGQFNYTDGSCATDSSTDMVALCTAFPNDTRCAVVSSIPGTPTAPAAVSGACNSVAAIQQVQSLIGTPVDGKWGAASQAALKASGQSFAALAPGCTGSVPTVAATSVYTPPATTTTTPVPTATVAPVSGTTAFLKSKFVGLPMYAWLGIGGTLIGVFIAMSRRQAAASVSDYGGGWY